MKILSLFLFLIVISFSSIADNILIMNSQGFNTAELALVNAIASNGHTVTFNPSTTITLPSNFTSTCIDPVNGYDWLCFFGNDDFSGLTPQIKTFINLGGKVFYQYEVNCCIQAQNSVAAILSELISLNITSNSNSFMAYGTSTPPAWGAINLKNCLNVYGNAYQPLDGLPLNNQLQATENINGSSPPITDNPNFGFFFSTTDFNFTGSTHKGGIIGLGDYNLWYNGNAPLSMGGSTPVNPVLVDFIFPNSSSPCYLFPPGCLDKIIPIPIAITATTILDMPNVFTPNNDSFNDLFVPQKMKNIEEATLYIFNRWGEQIHETNDLHKGWNGYLEGKLATDGTYFWKVNYKDYQGVEGSKMGFFTLIKE